MRSAVILIAVITAVGCGPPKDPVEPTPDPSTTPDIQARPLPDLGTFGSDHRDEIAGCMRDVFLVVSMEAWRGEEPDRDAAIEASSACYNAYFQTMMGQVILKPEDVVEALDAEIARQVAFHEALRDWKDLMDELDGEAATRILPPDELWVETHWDTTIVHGATIRVGDGGYLPAIPRVPAFTRAWGGEAATPAIVDEDMVIFLPGPPLGPSKDDPVVQALGDARDVTAEVDGAEEALLYGGFLVVETSTIITYDEMETLRTEYDVHALVQGMDDKGVAMLYTGPDEETPRLLGILMQWRGY